MAHDHDPHLAYPSEPIHAVTRPLERFMHVQAASGVVLVLATVVALVLANSPFDSAFLGFWKTQVGFRVGSFEMFHSLQHWINDGLMAVFFFVIGLEVKREIVIGELRDPRRAALPLVAALGGMVVPAALYLALQAGESGARGWGIPMATDIAFVVGCMAVLGSRVPHALRVMLLSLAIADDIGAILVIAIGYTEGINTTALLLAGAGLVAVWGMGRVGIRGLLPYVIVGTGIWIGFHESGVHATIAGVLLGLLTPARAYISQGRFAEVVDRARDIFHGGDWDSEEERATKVLRMRRLARETVPPVEFLETLLHPWVGFFIMPIFALANAGLAFDASYVSDPVAIAVGAGLFVGKPLGIVVFSFIAVMLGVARLPEGVTWGVILGGGFLAGIGFTMALFIAGLALDASMLDAAKLGILVASVAAGAVGMALLGALLPKGR